MSTDRQPSAAGEHERERLHVGDLDPDRELVKPNGPTETVVHFPEALAGDQSEGCATTHDPDTGRRLTARQLWDDTPVCRWCSGHASRHNGETGDAPAVAIPDAVVRPPRLRLTIRATKARHQRASGWSGSLRDSLDDYVDLGALADAEGEEVSGDE